MNNILNILKKIKGSIVTILQKTIYRMFQSSRSITCGFSIILIVLVLGYLGIRKFPNTGLIINSEVSERDLLWDKMDKSIESIFTIVQYTSNDIKSILKEIELSIDQKKGLTENCSNRILDITRKINFLNILINKINFSQSIEEGCFLIEQFEQMFFHDYIVRDVINVNIEFLENLKKIGVTSQKLLFTEFKQDVLPNIRSLKNIFNINIYGHTFDFTKYIFFPSDIDFFISLKGNIDEFDLVKLMKLVEYVCINSNDMDAHSWILKSKNNLEFLKIILKIKKSFEDFIFSI